MEKCGSYIYLLSFRSPLSRLCTSFVFIDINISTREPVWIYVIKRYRITMKSRTFYKKNALHWKVKVIFFLICQIKIYWMIVTNSFFFVCQNYTSSGGGIGEWVQFCWVGMGGVLDNITDSLTLDNSGKRVWRVSCLLQVNDNVHIFRKKVSQYKRLLVSPHQRLHSFWVAIKSCDARWHNPPSCLHNFICCWPCFCSEYTGNPVYKCHSRDP